MRTLPLPAAWWRCFTSFWREVNACWLVWSVPWMVDHTVNQGSYRSRTPSFVTPLTPAVAVFCLWFDDLAHLFLKKKKKQQMKWQWHGASWGGKIPDILHVSLTTSSSVKAGPAIKKKNEQISEWRETRTTFPSPHLYICGTFMGWYKSLWPYISQCSHRWSRVAFTFKNTFSSR